MTQSDRVKNINYLQCWFITHYFHSFTPLEVNFWSHVNENSINAELTLLSYTLNGNYERAENTDKISEYQDYKINTINSNSPEWNICRMVFDFDLNEATFHLRQQILQQSSN